MMNIMRFNRFCLTILCIILLGINNDMLCSTGKISAQEEIFGVGTKIVTQKNVWNFINSIFSFQAHDAKTTFLETQISYGLTNKLGIELLIPIFLNNTKQGIRRSGLSDIIIDILYKVWNPPTFVVNIFGGIKLATGNSTKKPRLGTGSLGFYGELETIHNSKHWYADSDFTMILNSRAKNRKPGHAFTGEFTVGPKIKFKKKSPSTLYLTLQMFGLFTGSNIEGTVFDPNSGGTVVFLGPLITWARKNWSIDGTFQIPIAQNLSGNQPNFDFFSGLTFKIKF